MERKPNTLQAAIAAIWESKSAESISLLSSPFCSITVLAALATV